MSALSCCSASIWHLRVQTVLSQLPPEVQQQGLVVQKKSSAVLQFIVLYSENGEQDPLFITNYAIINILDAISRTPGVGQAQLFGRMNYSMRIWFDSRRLTSLNLAPSDVIAAIKAQSVQAPVGRIGTRPISDQQQFQFNVQTQGRLDRCQAVWRHRAAGQSRRLGIADQRCGPRRDRRAEPRQ
jgi:multidrug efflux pump subunit AcrB